MESAASIFTENRDANANFMRSSYHQNKSLVDFEDMLLEKADPSFDKLSGLDGAESYGEYGASGHLVKSGAKPINENSKGNSIYIDIVPKELESFEVMLEDETMEEDKVRSNDTKNTLNTNKDIQLDSNVSWNDKDSSSDVQDSRPAVLMDDLIDKKMRRLSSETQEFNSSFKAQKGQDQMYKRGTLSHGSSTSGSDVVVPINSATLYEELRRAIKEGNRLKKNNQQYEVRNLELQGEVLEISRMASHYEAKSERHSTREDELRNELNAAIKKATRYQKEAGMCKKKVELLEGLFVDSEKRQVLVKKKLAEAEEKIKILELENKDFNNMLKDNRITQDGLNDALSQTDAASEVCHGNEMQEQTLDDLKDNKVVKAHACGQNRYYEYEEKEYRYLISALKQQLTEANAINKRYSVQVMHHVMAIDRLKVDNTKLKNDIKDMKNNDRGRKGKTFMYLQQYRESQVQMQCVQSELKKERAEKDDLKIQCKWIKKEVDRLKSSLSSRSSLEGMQDYSLSSKDKKKGEDAKIIEGATNLVEERMKLAKSVSKSSQVNGSQSQSPDDGNTRSDLNVFNASLGNKTQYDTLKDQHEKLSIEMALTRNTVKKLESDNSELRQEISLLKAEIALGLEAEQNDDSGGVIPGKYRRGNFEVVSKPANGKSEKQKSRRTQSMSGFRTTTASHLTTNVEQYDRAQSLIDLTKVSIDELDERRSSLKKHSSEGEQIYEDEKVMSNDNRRFAKSSKASMAENQNEILINEMASGSISAESDRNRKSSMTTSTHVNNTHKPLRSTISFKHTDELSSFGNFKKAGTSSKDYHVFKVPGALRVSPAAKSLNSFIYPSHENTEEEKQHSGKPPINEQQYNYVAV